MNAERWEGEWRPGLPVDRRLASKRLRDADSTLGDFEFSAARVVARYLGEQVELIDDGNSDAIVDGRIVYDDRPAGVFEVVTDTDPKWAATYDEIRRRRFEVRTGALTRRWQALVRSTAFTYSGLPRPAVTRRGATTGPHRRQAPDRHDVGTTTAGWNADRLPWGAPVGA